jgi:hypothetical protein
MAEKRQRRLSIVKVPDAVYQFGIVPYFDLASLQAWSQTQRQAAHITRQVLQSDGFCAIATEGRRKCTVGTQFGDRSCREYCLRDIKAWFHDLYSFFKANGAIGFFFYLTDPDLYSFRVQVEAINVDAPVLPTQWGNLSWPGYLSLFTQRIDEEDKQLNDLEFDGEQYRLDMRTLKYPNDPLLIGQPDGKELDVDEHLRVERANEAEIKAASKEELTVMVEGKKQFAWRVVDYQLEQMQGFLKLPYKLRLELRCDGTNVFQQFPDRFRLEGIRPSISPTTWYYNADIFDRVRNDDPILILLNRIRDALFRICGYLEIHYDQGHHFDEPLEKIGGLIDLQATWQVLRANSADLSVALVQFGYSPDFVQELAIPSLNQDSNPANSFNQFIADVIVNVTTQWTLDSQRAESNDPDALDDTISNMFQSIKGATKRYLLFMKYLWSNRPDKSKYL